MISSKNRVQAIKSKFENLTVENDSLVSKRRNTKHLSKQTGELNFIERITQDKENEIAANFTENASPHENFSDAENHNDWSLEPNKSYLHGKNDLKRSISDTKKSLTRQTSDPCKKLHRSHAFRCDRSQKINQSPKRHGSCNGRSETSDFAYKMGDRKLTKERLKLLGDFIEDQMRKDNFPTGMNPAIVGTVQEVKGRQVVDSIPDAQVPKHILDQYAKVVKAKPDKHDAMTDSGVSSETENLEEEKSSKIKQLITQYEKPDTELKTLKDDHTKPISSTDSTSNTKLTTDKLNSITDSNSSKVTIDTADGNLESMNDLCASSETMRLEKKNPHLTLTDTLKKALKQPLPAGPPPKKPPRTFIPPIPESPDKQRKDPWKMLEKLEQVLQKREVESKTHTEGEVRVQNQKEMHYLCTEILDIAQRLPHSDPFSCFPLNCAMVNNSMSSLPYTRLSSARNSLGKACSCSNDNLNVKPLSTFGECGKCQSNNQNEGFICHLNCECKESKSEFYVKEHIYDEPFVEADSKRYGTLNQLKNSRSLENLVVTADEDQKIYDIPCEITPPASPKLAPKSDFQKLRENFEKAPRKDTDNPKPETKIQTLRPLDNVNIKSLKNEKPVSLPPKPILASKPKVWKSTENISEEFKVARKNVEKRFATDGRRYRRERERERKRGLSLPKEQLDVDKENLNRLMTEIYETVTAACNMDENKPSSFPTEHSDGSTSEESFKLTRSLTESRKNYVRRVSSRVAYLDQKNVKTTRFRHQTSVCSYKSEILDNPYSTFRSWKSFRTSQGNLREKMDKDLTDSKVNLTDSSGNILSMKNELCSSDNSLGADDLSIDEKAGCVDIDLPFEPRERGLFNVCLLVGLNYMTGEAYVKSVFPSQVQVPPHIENLIFPETISSESKGEWSTEGKAAQCYSLVLTDERGERSYGYCRRVLPEGASTCLPLCYCLIGKYRSPGFYYKILQEIESHHGSSEIEINQILEQLFEMDFPDPGEQITITYTQKNCEEKNSPPKNSPRKCMTLPDQRRLDCKLELNVSVRKEAVDMSEKNSENSEKSDKLEENSDSPHELPDFYDLENNNSPKTVMVNVVGPRTHIIKRPLDPRMDENSLSTVLDTLGAGLLIKVFASLLLERKVIIMGDKLSVVSSCLEGLQCALYPLVWQQPLISAVPRQIRRDVLAAPLPILAGVLRASTGEVEGVEGFEEGMLIDLTLPTKVQFYQGDESTILPTASYKALKSALQMESARSKEHDDVSTRNVLISEAFLRFFVDVVGEAGSFLARGAAGEGALGKHGFVFDREAFIKHASSKQKQYFLEWFSETAMFNHLICNLAALQASAPPVDAPLPAHYALLLRTRAPPPPAPARPSYRQALHARLRTLKARLRDLAA